MSSPGRIIDHSQIPHALDFFLWTIRVSAVAHPYANHLKLPLIFAAGAIGCKRWLGHSSLLTQAYRCTLVR